MKTVKTVNGVKKIEDRDASLILFQLKSILKEHRMTLVDKILSGGLELYIDYKFNTRPAPELLQEVRLKLDELRKDGIDAEMYRHVFETVLKNQSTILGNTIFYNEIDGAIKEALHQPQFFNEVRQFAAR
jgi:hypothetical protein